MATDAQLRSRLSGRIGSSVWEVAFVSASTVSHFRRPRGPPAAPALRPPRVSSPGPPPPPSPDDAIWLSSSRGVVLGEARLLQLTSRFSSGTTDHSRWCTDDSEVVEMFSRLRAMSARLCSDGLLLILISGELSSGGGGGGGAAGGGSFDGRRPTRFLRNASKRRLRGTGPVNDPVCGLPSPLPPVPPTPPPPGPAPAPVAATPLEGTIGDDWIQLAGPRRSPCPEPPSEVGRAARVGTI